jgi:GrpB-like predicted nucleotidyltransferase (UPF0157 family)
MATGEERVRIVAYDPSWVARFDTQRDRLQALLAPWITGGVHHVGSTAVPGLAAKPTVDIMVGVASLEASRAAVAALEADGWLYYPYRPQEMHWFCRPSVNRREFHLHLVPTGSTAYRSRLAFRDALRDDPTMASTYATHKRALACLFSDDREAYTDAKGGFIDEVVRRALGK